VVEVSPPYDDRAESTAWAAADLVYELFGLMVANPLYAVEVFIAPKSHQSKVGEMGVRKTSCERKRRPLLTWAWLCKLLCKFQ
jgi:hypothetical protein